MLRDGKRYWLYYDQIGSLKAVVGDAERIVKALHYDAFGTLLADSNPGFTVPLGYGGLPDRHTGLIRFGLRDYDPDVARWTAKDPIGYAGGDNDLYGYCLDDPINGVDPEGLASWREFVDGPGGRIVKQGLLRGATTAALGATGGAFFAGLGALPGGVAGGLIGFPLGLLEGVVKEAVFKGEEPVTDTFEQRKELGDTEFKFKK